ncbi:MAG: hypothetical protein DCC58_05425 [Chloroflexi bacterium]|nr:MAG: hypothetical protein DCC58_05425 [Chloroflexota bacterium]
MRRNSTPRGRSKHQHWVPQFYLRYFATAASRSEEYPQVWIFSTEPDDGDEKLTSVRNVCGKRFLYSPVQPGGERDWSLDERLDSLESALGMVWPALAEGFVNLADQPLRQGIALFTAVMYLRNPEVRSEVEQIHRKLVLLYEAAPRLPDGTLNIGSIEISGQVHRFDSSGWHEYRSWTKNEHDRFFAQLVRSEATRIADHLLRKRWSVVFANEETFITTDKPVAMHHQSKERYGFGTEGTMITFPLSPTRMLVLDDMHNEPANQYYPLQDGSGASFNFTTWRNASRFLITGRPVPVVLEEMLALETVT